MPETVKRKRIVRLRRSERLSLQICIGAVLIVVIGGTLVPFFLTVLNSLKSNIEVQKSIFRFRHCTRCNGAIILPRLRMWEITLSTAS